ncbi:hypothetical protein BDR26DRAFT_850084 [Obelidium mucronatum]|nr:hypothetical protein BDR26DRAFT_850084 [Obelidium mucronatum]
MSSNPFPPALAAPPADRRSHSPGNPFVSAPPNPFAPSMALNPAANPFNPFASSNASASNATTQSSSQDLLGLFDPLATPTPAPTPAIQPSLSVTGIPSTLDDEALAKILQEEEDSAFASSENNGVGNSSMGPPYWGTGFNNQQQSNHYQQQPPRPQHQQPQQYQAYQSSSLIPSTPAYNPPYVPPTPSLYSYNPNGGIGKPFHEYGFAEETVPGSRFQSDWRDFDVCFWDRECVTVMEGTQKLFYVNLLGNNAINHKWVMQRQDELGLTLYILSASVGTKGFSLFDTQLGKAVGCTKTKPGQMTFSTITNSEKLIWKNGDLRVLQEVNLFSAIKRTSTAHAPHVPADNDLFAYVIRTVREDSLTRTRIRIGGRGSSRADFVIASYVGMVLLDRFC